MNEIVPFMKSDLFMFDCTFVIRNNYDLAMQEIFDFLSELEVNNNRDWFHQNKKRYLIIKKLFDKYVAGLIEEISFFDPEISNVSVDQSLYRIYRDVRFSPDKTPYNTYLNASIKLGGKKSLRGGYYVHLQPGRSLFGGGIGGRDANLLKAVRKDIYNTMDEFKSIVQNEEFKQHYTFGDEKLKKVPSPFPKDDPDGDWLKYKRYTPASFVPDSFFSGEDAVQRSVGRLKLLVPLNRFLNYTIDESMSNY